MAQPTKFSRPNVGLVIWLLLSLLFAKILFVILYEYRFYFPADFVNSSFLIAREDYFYGLYGIAFYSHIVAGPFTLVGAFFLMLTGGVHKFGALHKTVGRIVLLLVLLVIVPSGLVMSTKAFTGAIAGWGFALTSMFTGICAMLAIYYARQRMFKLHQVWACRCFIFLCSPVVLRLISGAAFVTASESELSYQLSAWLSWLVPLAGFEIFRRIPKSTLDRQLTQG